MTPSAQGVDDRVEVSRLLCEFDDMQQSESDLNQGDCVFCATGTTLSESAGKKPGPQPEHPPSKHSIPSTHKN